jgi:thiol-disulfide isomerase/thioredoxin
VVKQTLKDIRRLPLSTVLLACVAAAAVSAIAVALLFGGSDGDEPEAAEGTYGTIMLEEGGDTVGSPVGDTPYTVFGSDEETDLTSYAGRPLVVNFFASWCGPCVTEMPDFEQVHQDLGDEVAFLGLATRDQADATQALLDQTGVSYDIGRDTRGDVLVDLGGLQLPTTVLVAADGTITSVNTGELTATELTEKIQTQLLG